MDRPRRYSSIRYGLAITETFYLFALLFFFAASGHSRALRDTLYSFASVKFVAVGAYFLAVYALYWILELPFSLLGSYWLEHKFSLSTQKLSAWFKDKFKELAVSCVIGLALSEAFYYLTGEFSQGWWLAVSLCWIVFSLILSNLLPVLIVPLFFKYRTLSDSVLKERIKNLAGRMQIKILDVFEIDFSKKTQKANAALLGWGNTKRVILADTLKDKYTHDEIEVILTHEFAHYKLRHMLKLIMINASGVMLSFYIIYATSKPVFAVFKLSSVADIAAFPILALYLLVLGIIMQPLQNYLSRAMENNADKVAVKMTGLKEAFISMMEKLSAQNLADKNPHPLIKFFFFDHPPVDERILRAKLS